MVKEKILITGGVGYFGNILIDYFLDKGHKVICLDNLTYGQKSLLNFVLKALTDTYVVLYQAEYKKNVSNRRYDIFKNEK